MFKIAQFFPISVSILFAITLTVYYFQNIMFSRSITNWMYRSRWCYVLLHGGERVRRKTIHGDSVRDQRARLRWELSAVLWVINMIESWGEGMQLVQLWGFRFAAGDAHAERAGEGDSEREGGRRVRWGLLAGLLRAINKCRCQHPPLDPRLSHVSSPSRSLSISFSVHPLSPSSFSSSLSCALLHGAPRSSFHRSRGTTR